VLQPVVLLLIVHNQLVRRKVLDHVLHSRHLPRVV
jgi:hypothetical protein